MIRKLMQRLRCRRGRHQWETRNNNYSRRYCSCEGCDGEEWLFYRRHTRPGEPTLVWEDMSTSRINRQLKRITRRTQRRWLRG